MKTILIVDDSAAVRSMVKLMLMWEAFDFLEADEGERALQLVSLMPIDLVVADVKMPITDGFTFVRRLRASSEPNLRRLPVILLSGDQSMKEQGLAAGANDFLHKPVTGPTLVAAVQRLLAATDQP